MKKYYEIEFVEDCDLTEKDIKLIIEEIFSSVYIFDVHEIPKPIPQNISYNCDNSKVIADGNKGMERG